MRVLLVDDEAAARRRLVIMLEELDVEVVGEAGNGVEALDLVAQRRPDVVLLDIAMPEVDGLDVARHLPEPKPLIVFQTAYDEYALRAFEHEAVDYVVKPVTLDRLRQALDRASKRLAARVRAELTVDLLRRMEQAVTDRSRAARPRLLVRDGSGRRLLPLRAISRFVSADGIVYAYSQSGRYATDYTLGELGNRTPGLFVRANRSELLGLEWISRIESNGDGSASITLSDETLVHVSRRRAAEVRRILES